MWVGGEERKGPYFLGSLELGPDHYVLVTSEFSLEAQASRLGLQSTTGVGATGVFRSLSDSTVGRVLALHKAYLGSVLGSTYGFLTHIKSDF